MNELGHIDTMCCPNRSSPAPSLVAEYDYLAQRIARRYMHGHAVDDDLVQVARLGLVEAATRYDAQRGPFASFATPTIIGTLKKHLRSTGWAVHVPRSVQEQTITVENCVDALTQRLGRAPEISDIADATGLSAEHVLRARRAREGRFSRRLPVQDHDVAPGTEERSILQVALGVLDHNDRQLVELRYVEDLTQQEIAIRLGVSQPQVYRRLKAITTCLRDELDDRESRPLPAIGGGAITPGASSGDQTIDLTQEHAEPSHLRLAAY